MLQTASSRVTTIAMAAKEQLAIARSATETESTLLFATALSENTTISYLNCVRTAIRLAIIAL